MQLMSAIPMVFMRVALVGLAMGLGARYPRFGADVSQVAGSYGGVAVMLQAVLFVMLVIVLLSWPSSLFLLHQTRGTPFTVGQELLTAACFATAAGLSVGIWLLSMRAGVRALERMG